MRLANDKDQEIIRSAISNSSSSTISFLSSIGNGEAIAFGDAVAVPMRICFERIPDHALPKTASGRGIDVSLHRMEEGSPDLRHIGKNMRHTDTDFRPANMAPQHTANRVPSVEALSAKQSSTEGTITSTIAQPGDTPSPLTSADTAGHAKQSLGSVHSLLAREAGYDETPLED